MEAGLLPPPPPGLNSHLVVPSVGASGGLLTAWDSRAVSLVRSHSLDSSLTCVFAYNADGMKFAVANIYAPCDHDLRTAFLDELSHVCTLVSGPLLLFGDFNLTRTPEDKNTDSFDATAAAAFNDAIDGLLLQELPLLDRRFTWSNMCASPTLLRLDRAFIIPGWASVLFNSTLESLPRPTSDHVPLLVTAATAAPVAPIFRYEKGWVLDPEYQELVAGIWARPQNLCGTPSDRVCNNIKWTRAATKMWVHGRKRPAACRAVLELLDLLEEHHPLPAAESLLRSLVKARLVHAVREHAMYWRQLYTIKTCKMGDENTAFYHASASARLRANKI